MVKIGYEHPYTNEFIPLDDSDAHSGKSTLDSYRALLETIGNLYERKNTDYGSSVDITYLMFGETANLVRLWDKLLRLTQLHLSGKSLVKEESYRDTKEDLANYALIGCALHDTYNGDPEELGRLFTEFIKKAKDRGGSNVE